jgi:hypothetical protein
MRSKRRLPSLVEGDETVQAVDPRGTRDKKPRLTKLRAEFVEDAVNPAFIEKDTLAGCSVEKAAVTMHLEPYLGSWDLVPMRARVPPELALAVRDLAEIAFQIQRDTVRNLYVVAMVEFPL